MLNSFGPGCVARTHVGCDPNYLQAAGGHGGPQGRAVHKGVQQQHGHAAHQKQTRPHPDTEPHADTLLPQAAVLAGCGEVQVAIGRFSPDPE